MFIGIEIGSTKDSSREAQRRLNRIYSRLVLQDDTDSREVASDPTNTIEDIKRIIVGEEPVSTWENQ